MRIRDGRLHPTVRTAAALVGLLLALLLGRCGGPPPEGGAARILFSDDLRVWSVRPDGADAREVHGKGSQTPLAWKGGLLFASYRGPYLLFDPLRPGIYRADAAGRHRHRIKDCPALPLLQGVGREGLLYLLPEDRATLRLLNPMTGKERTLALPAPARCAAPSPDGGRCAVVLEPRFRTVVLGNQAWFTEGSDVLLVSLVGGEATSLPLPSLLAPSDGPPKLEDYAASGLAAVAWLSEDVLLFSSSPGLWSEEVRGPGAPTLLRPRRSGEAVADGLAVDAGRGRLAFTAGGRLFLREIPSGTERDITPAALVGGAHHPAWMEAAGGK